MYGDDFYRDFSIALTGLNFDQIKALAGVMVFAPDGRLLWRS